MTTTTPNFLRLATSPQVVRTASKVCLLVGTLLAGINHGPAIADGSLTSGRVIQILLTYLVPYSVSTYSSVRTLQASVPCPESGNPAGSHT